MTMEYRCSKCGGNIGSYSMGCNCPTTEFNFNNPDPKDFEIEGGEVHIDTNEHLPLPKKTEWKHVLTNDHPGDILKKHKETNSEINRQKAIIGSLCKITKEWISDCDCSECKSKIRTIKDVLEK